MWLVDVEPSGRDQFYRTSRLQAQQPSRCSEVEDLIRFSSFHRFSFMFVLLMSFHLPLVTQIEHMMLEVETYMKKFSGAEC